MVQATPLAGTAYLTIDGTSYLLVKFGYSPATVKRETIAGMDRVHGFKQTPTPGVMKATIRDAGNMSVAAFNALTSSTVVAELINGKTIIGRGCWTVDSQEVDSEEATFDVEFNSLSVTEN